MRVASLRLRFLAGLINVAAGIGVWGTATGLWIAGAAAYARLRSGAGDQEPDVNAEPPDFHPRLRKLFESRQMQGASTSLAIAGRNLRGLGYRTVGLRRASPIVADIDAPQIGQLMSSVASSSIPLAEPVFLHSTPMYLKGCTRSCGSAEWARTRSVD